MVKFSFTYKRKNINLDVDSCKNFGIGLMFSKRNSRPLLFDFKKLTREAIHSFFVFFPFIAIWLDENNNVIETQVVRPFTLLVRPRKQFYRLIEIPLNDKYKQLIKLLVEN